MSIPLNEYNITVYGDPYKYDPALQMAFEATVANSIIRGQIAKTSVGKLVLSRIKNGPGDVEIYPRYKTGLNAEADYKLKSNSSGRLIGKDPHKNSGMVQTPAMEGNNACFAGDSFQSFFFNPAEQAQTVQSSPTGKYGLPETLVLLSKYFGERGTGNEGAPVGGYLDCRAGRSVFASRSRDWLSCLRDLSSKASSSLCDRCLRWCRTCKERWQASRISRNSAATGSSERIMFA